MAAIVLVVAASSFFGQTPKPSPNPELIPAAQLIRQGENKKAIGLLKKAIKKDKTDGEAWYYLGVAYLQTNDFKKGAEAFQKAIEARPDLAAQVHGRYAYALVLRNELDKAVISANTALNVDPKNIEALYTLGIVDLRRGAAAPDGGDRAAAAASRRTDPGARVRRPGDPRGARPL